MSKVTKKSLAIAIYATIVSSNEDHKRKAFINAFNTKHEETFGEKAKANLAPTYYQMLKNEAEGKEGGFYRYHKKKSVDVETKVEETVSVVEEPISIVIPETMKWKVVGETTQYFANRDAARAYKKANGGNLEKVA